jgi:hypothetical protein
MVEARQTADKVSLAGGVLASLFGLWFIFFSAVSVLFEQTDCPGLGSPHPAAGCAYGTFFTLYAPEHNIYPLLMLGIVLELVGLLLLIIRPVYFRSDKVHVSARGRFPLNVEIISLGLGYSFVIFIGIALTPFTAGCSMQISTIPAPQCAYLPYAILFEWGGIYIWGLGLLLQIIGFVILVFRQPDLKIGKSRLITAQSQNSA